MAKKGKVSFLLILIILFTFFIIIIWFFLFFSPLLKNSAPVKNISTLANQNLNSEPKKARLIDGLFVSLDTQDLWPVGVVIENSADAWPLAGINEANLVYETTAEAGITRFLAIYANDKIIDKIGPVRSVRPYFIDWAKEYDAIFTHVGGSPEALIQLKKDGIKDLDQYFQSQYYWREFKRLAPHNVYTSSALLKKARNDLVRNEIPIYEPWFYKDDLFPSQRPEQQDIEINFSTPLYKVNWQYNKEKNDYLRFQANQKFLTEDAQEVRSKNIIIQYTVVKVIDEIGRRDITTIGQGKALLFLDGKAKEGFWQRTAKDQRTKFLDENSDEIKLNRGPTWIEVVSANTLIGYK
jgi:hypothetical protein